MNAYTAPEIMKKLKLTAFQLNEVIQNIRKDDPSFAPKNLGGPMGFFAEEQFNRIKQEAGNVVEFSSFKNFFAQEQKQLEEDERKEIENIQARFQIKRDKLLDEAAEKWSKVHAELPFVERIQHLSREMDEMRKSFMRKTGKLSPERKNELGVAVVDFLNSAEDRHRYFTAEEIFEAVPDVRNHWETIKKYLLDLREMEHNGLERNQRAYRSTT